MAFGDPYSGSSYALPQNNQNLIQQQIANQQNAIAQAQLANARYATTLGSDTAKQLAAGQNATALQLAAANAAAQLQGTSMQTQTAQNIAAATQSGETERQRMSESGQTQRTAMTTQEALQQAQYVADAQRAAQQFAAEQQLAGTKYSSDQGLTGTKYSADAQLQAALAATQEQKYQADLSQGRFNTLLPILQQSYTGMLNSSGSTDSTATLPPAPTIDVNPIYSGHQIQERVNQTRAGNDAATASKTATMQRDLAGRGFGSQSPLAKELGAQYQGQNLATNTGAENDLRFQAASANSNQILQQQQAQSAQYQAQLQAMNQAKQIKATQQSALLQALASLAH